MKNGPVRNGEGKKSKIKFKNIPPKPRLSSPNLGANTFRD